MVASRSHRRVLPLVSRFEYIDAQHVRACPILFSQKWLFVYFYFLLYRRRQLYETRLSCCFGSGRVNLALLLEHSFVGSDRVYACLDYRHCLTTAGRPRALAAGTRCGTQRPLRSRPT